MIVDVRRTKTVCTSLKIDLEYALTYYLSFWPGSYMRKICYRRRVLENKVPADNNVTKWT